MIRKPLFSNALLSLGVTMLAGFGLMELSGLHSDPLLPALSALLIGCTAVIDRVTSPEVK